MRKVLKNEKNKLKSPNSPKNQHEESPVDDAANALLDSDSEDMMDSQIRRQPNPLNTNLTEQAIVSIYTQDDENPLSENGDRDSASYRDG